MGYSGIKIAVTTVGLVLGANPITCSYFSQEDLTLKLRIATLFLTILCLALSAPAFAGTIFSEGPLDGNDNAFFITGPNNANIVGSFQDISNGFTAAISGTPNNLDFGLWIGSGITPTTVDYEIGTTAFGTDLGSGTVALNGSNSTFLFTNGIGFDIYNINIPVTSGAMTAGNMYWLSLSNANDAINSGTEAWDIPNGGLGGPAICNFRQSGTNFGNCGLGGETFTLTSGVNTTPEPGSIMLFGSGILGLAGVLRRKINL
jgi:PEP-CTERM motif